MVQSLARRGPDSEGTHAWPGAALGHRRLAIIDLSPAGRQPMLSDDGQIGVTFNGCIYNFLEIKSELEHCGHSFRSRCDTEVLIRGYEQWGIDGLVPRLRGMFAFGIWDHKSRKLFLVRDRLGVKPLLYVVRNGSIAFASTIAALRQSNMTGDIAPEAVLEFLEFDWVSEGRAIFEGARKIPAGVIAEWHDGIVSERAYWTLPEQGTAKIGFEEAVERTEALLVESARLRLVSDVPIGALLSGGIDSSLVCWAMAAAGANITSYTVSTPGDPSDETEAARATARLLGIPHEVVDLSETEQPALEDLANAYGEPFACGSALAMLRVCKAIKPVATVLLTGDGGDDIFLGYEHYKTFFLAQRIAGMLPDGLHSVWPSLMPAFGGIRPLRRFSRLIDYATGGLGAVTKAHDGLAYFERADILGDRFRDLSTSHREIPRSSGRHLLRDVLSYEFRNRFMSEFMTKVDGGSMYYGIEARSPLLDHRLWELGASLPFSVRLHGGELKAVLRAIARKHLGKEVAARRKQGFTVPVGRWLAGKWKPELEELRGDSLLASEGWIRRGSLDSAIGKSAARGQVPRQLWSLLVFERWLRSIRTRLPATH
jgi:asparagine synthase (glutamine-hydrolysing)